MIQLEQRISTFVSLRKYLEEIVSLKNNLDTEIDNLFVKAESKNPWFTRFNIMNAIEGIIAMLDENQLKSWILKYPWLQTKTGGKTVAIIMAGNIPMVGFHDFLCVLISGCKVKCKLSSKDDVLLPWLAQRIIKIEPEFQERISFEMSVLRDFDAVIATGSDNSSRYFEYYFNKYPSIIRRNRTSIAILDGSETKDELDCLSFDLFSYFGLGCRNVSKIFIPEQFDVTKLLANFDSIEYLKNHFKYMNNYEYNKSVFLLNQDAHYDNGFVILKECEDLFSPIAVVYYEKYKDIRNLDVWLERNSRYIQCVVTKDKQLKYASTVLGKSQFPHIDDYADAIDTMSFLETLN